MGYQSCDRLSVRGRSAFREIIKIGDSTEFNDTVEPNQPANC